MSITMYPTPSPEGVVKLQAYYHTHCQMEVSEETAFEVLSGIMRFLYLTEVRPPVPHSSVTIAPPEHPDCHYSYRHYSYRRQST